MAKTICSRLPHCSHLTCVGSDACKQEENKLQRKKRTCTCEDCAKKHAKSTKSGTQHTAHNCRWCRTVPKRVSQDLKTKSKATCDPSVNPTCIDWQLEAQPNNAYNDGIAKNELCEHRSEGQRAKRGPMRERLCVERSKRCRRWRPRPRREHLVCHDHKNHRRCTNCDEGVVCAKCGFACSRQGAQSDVCSCCCPACGGKAHKGGTLTRCSLASRPHRNTDGAGVSGGCFCAGCVGGVVVGHPFGCICFLCSGYASLCA